MADGKWQMANGRWQMAEPLLARRSRSPQRILNLRPAVKVADGIAHHQLPRRAYRFPLHQVVKRQPEPREKRIVEHELPMEKARELDPVHQPCRVVPALVATVRGEGEVKLKSKEQEQEEEEERPGLR